jgi:hypothetical protein
VSVNGGKARTIPVNDFSLVQQVRVPAGDDLISFHYRPRHLLLASILSLGAIALLLALLGVWLVRRLRGSRNAPGIATPSDADVAADSPAGLPARVG